MNVSTIPDCFKQLGITIHLVPQKHIPTIICTLLMNQKTSSFKGKLFNLQFEWISQKQLNSLSYYKFLHYTEEMRIVQFWYISYMTKFYIAIQYNTIVIFYD